VAWFAVGGDLRARNAGSSWLGCAGAMCGVAERMRVWVAAILFVWAVVLWCIRLLYVVGGGA
jgi:hypothetical protein